MFYDGSNDQRPTTNITPRSTETRPKREVVTRPKQHDLNTR